VAASLNQNDLQNIKPNVLFESRQNKQTLPQSNTGCSEGRRVECVFYQELLEPEEEK
jgi:hypothetical protein